METIKNFDSFMKKAKDKKVEENIFGDLKQKRKEKKALKMASAGADKVKNTRGRETYVDATGVKHKVVWKAQDSANFIVKLVNDYNWLDTNGSLTQQGQDALLNYLNQENAFLNVYGKLDDTFFKTKIIAYSVKIDNDRKQKIQFTIVDKQYLVSLGMDETVLATQKFLNSSMISDTSIKQNQDSIIDVPLPIVIDDGTDEVIDDGTDEVIDDGEDDGEEDDLQPVDDSLIGKKFEYQSGNDNKLYFVEVMEGDDDKYKFYAKSKDGSNEGWITYDGDEPIWTGKDGNPTAITNAKDRAFFLRIYTDLEYLKELIGLFDEKYPDGGDFSIKDILYYMDGSQIYPRQGTGTVIGTTIAANNTENTENTTEEEKTKQ